MYRRDGRAGFRKAHYYVCYLGWKECQGLAGREFTESVVKDLSIRRKQEKPFTLTLELTRTELKIYQTKKGRFGRTEKLNFPTVQTKDITYAVQGLTPDEDVVACIFLGYNPTTRKAVHVHVYRFDSPETAATFTDSLNDIIRQPEHEERIRLIEDDLVSRGEIAPKPRNFSRGFKTPSAVYTRVGDSAAGELPRADVDPYAEEKEEKMESLAAELKRRLGKKGEPPLLLPPQDYDTVRRMKGNLDLGDEAEYEARKCKIECIVGEVGAAGTDSGEQRRSRPNSGSDMGSLERGLAFGLSGHSPVSSHSSRSGRSDQHRASSRSPHLYDGEQRTADRRSVGGSAELFSSKAIFMATDQGGQPLLRQVSADSYLSPDGRGGYSIQARNEGKKASEKKQKKKKKGKLEEPPPDYTLHPSDRFKRIMSYS